MSSGFQLPARSTRGKRMRAAMAEEEDAADAEFWNQEFFAEEAMDEDYQAPEVEEEDVVDSDFDEPEDDEDEDEAEEAAEKPKRKVLKAPEPKAAPKPKAPKAPKLEPTAGEPGPSRRESSPAEPVVFAPPSLRRSTQVKSAQAEIMRQERARPTQRRSSKASDWRPLSQAELLAEAARTEVDNTYSLRQLLAMEEATKKKATVVKQVYRGATVKWASRRRPVANPLPNPVTAATSAAAAPLAATAQPAAAGAQQPSADAAAAKSTEQDGAGTSAAQADGAATAGALGKEGEDKDKAQPAKDETQYEATLVYELHNMTYPPIWLRRWKAPPVPARLLDPLTNTPARYKDPSSKQGFSSVASFKRLRGLPVPRSAPAPAPLPPLPSNKGFNTTTCVFGGSSQRTALPPQAKSVLARIPPEAPPPDPPSLLIPPVPAGSLPPTMMSMVVELARAMAER